MRYLTSTAVLLAAASPAFSQAFLDSGHFDLEVKAEIVGSTVEEVEFEIKNKEFPSGPFLEEYETDEAFLVPGDFRIQSGALGGIADGSPVYFVPEVQNPETLWLGMASDETGPGVLENDAFEVTLTGFSGPGTFVASQAGALGGDVIFIDTSDGIVGDAPLVASALGDNHYEYAFDTPGLYELTFTATGTLTQAFGGGQVSATDTYVFFIPEPATAGLVGVAAMGFLRRRR